MQVPILSGVYADAQANLRQGLPVNLEPSIIDSGLSKGTLSSASGVTQIATGPGNDYGGINWNGVSYRVSGTSLISVSETGAVTVLGDVGTTGPVRMDYSFDRLAINAGSRLYYYSTSGLQQVTDVDLGAVLDVVWVDGYFMTTDGENLVVTELSNPFNVDPLKYGSSEEDPDPIVGLRKNRGEIYALNRYTIENFINIGGSGFPFSRNAAGLIPRGCVSSRGHCDFAETFAFVGGGRNERIGVFLAGQGQSIRISTDEVERLLAGLNDTQQAALELESLVQYGEERLWLHLPDRTLVYSFHASKTVGDPIWHTLASGAGANQVYVARHPVLMAGKWQVGCVNTNQIGVLDEGVSTHFGQIAGWKLNTVFLYNQSRGGIIKTLELIGLPGHAPFGVQTTAFLSMTRDGVTYSQRYAVNTGGDGGRGQRVQWRPRVRFSNYLGLTFQGADAGLVNWARLEADVEPLNV